MQSVPANGIPEMHNLSNNALYTLMLDYMNYKLDYTLNFGKELGLIWGTRAMKRTCHCFMSALPSLLATGKGPPSGTPLGLEVASLKTLLPPFLQFPNTRMTPSIGLWISTSGLPTSTHILGSQFSTSLEYYELWVGLREVFLDEGVDDEIVWKLSPSGEYTASSAYKAQLDDSTASKMKSAVWNNWAPPKHKFFAWLIIQDRVWRRTGFNGEDGQIAAYASYARGSQRRRHTSSSAIDTRYAFGRRLRLGWV